MPPLLYTDPRVPKKVSKQTIDWHPLVVANRILEVYNPPEHIASLSIDHIPHEIFPPSSSKQVHESRSKCCDISHVPQKSSVFPGSKPSDTQLGCAAQPDQPHCMPLPCLGHACEDAHNDFETSTCHRAGCGNKEMATQQMRLSSVGVSIYTVVLNKIQRFLC